MNDVASDERNGCDGLELDNTLSDRHLLPVTDTPTEPDDQLTRLIVAVFRLNGALIAAGDQLVADLPLTSARWQVLGAVAQSAAPLPVASIARNMGLTRQGIRAIVKELIAADLVQLAPNPHHRRAQLVHLTPEGQRANAEAMARQRPWAKSVAEGVPADRIADTVDLLHALLARLADGRKGGNEP